MSTAEAPERKDSGFPTAVDDQVRSNTAHREKIQYPFGTIFLPLSNESLSPYFFWDLLHFKRENISPWHRK